MKDTSPEAPFNRPLARRQFLGRGVKGVAALGLSGGVGSVIAACGSSSSTSSAANATATSSLTPASLQLCYLENVQFAGSYFAQTKGYYKDAGLDVTLIPGGPSLAPEPVVVSGKALVGVSHTAEVIGAILNGADLKIIGATYQKNPTCIVSKASKPIKVPTDMYGKKVGISDTNAPIWASFVKANKLDLSKITVVTVGFDVTSLASGEIDGLMAFAANEPTILKLQGVAPYVLLLSDFHYPLLEDLYIATGANLADPSKAKTIAALMTGESRGWTDVVADPDEAATLAVNDFGKGIGLSLPQQKLEAQAQNGFVVDADTKTHGLFWMTPAKISGTIASLALGGVKATPSMFTTQILSQVYKGGSVAA
ncbi:MAG TPA: ABC transporter substrate-binding protein [Solirubrobacteraceae bacterium]|jgi:ABC-type nitrate/sulfonate/bicarbonate transport system substrate-binding protein|nr:ABC transporter substrate-binding protein [Solirubrobacteraceae bacterium]